MAGELGKGDMIGALLPALAPPTAPPMAEVVRFGGAGRSGMSFHPPSARLGGGGGGAGAAACWASIGGAYADSWIVGGAGIIG